MARTRSSSNAVVAPRHNADVMDTTARPVGSPGVAVLLRAGEERLRPLLSALANRKDKTTWPA
jgi:hypothetical protein